jgi:curved DNA-binding protein CbpA
LSSRWRAWRLVRLHRTARPSVAEHDRRLGADPFLLLGLDPAADPTDDEVRGAWRRVAAATHPDRADGGDPARFAAAAAAYTELRTPFGRGEARADRAGRARGSPHAVRQRRPLPPDIPGAAWDDRPTGRGGVSGWLRPAMFRRATASAKVRIGGGRPGRLALRVLTCAAVSGIAILAAWPRPAAPALVTGALTWLVLTARQDLAPARPTPDRGRSAKALRR